MDSKELNYERAKLKETIHKLDEKEAKLKSTLSNTSSLYSKEDFIRAHLIYVNEKQLKNIAKIKDAPYFARIDFTENGEQKENLYIGKSSILDDEGTKPIVVDWRAPISNLYYDGRIGKSSYKVDDREIEGIISLKRQYFIKNQTLEKYTDIDLKANDELLQNALSRNADDRLRNIVSTIQEEQNKIIRADMNKPLIVQGVAGSGKTTIALHRIAYLIYNYEKDFKPEEFMIIAPNKFFLNYISNVLPDLGVENVKQYTFEDFAWQVTGKKLKISDSNEKLVTIVNKDFNSINKGNIDVMIEESKLKSSIKFKKIVDCYLEDVELNFIPKKDFTILNYRITTYDEIQKLFLKEYKMYDFDKRINEIKKHLLSDLNKKAEAISEKIINERRKRIHDLISSQFNQERFDLLKEKYIKYKEETGLEGSELRNKLKEDSGDNFTLDEYIELKNLREIKKTLSERRIEIFEEYEEILKKLEIDRKKLVDDYFKEVGKYDSTECYSEFIKKYPEVYIENKELSTYLRENTLKNLKNKEICFEDLAPIIYIHYKIHGTKFKEALHHIIIDEAQDYGEFQFSVLKTILKSNSLTILGDLAQGVHYYRGIENWKEFIDTQFENVNTTYTTLSKTYRTTREIMDVANNVISKLSKREKEFIVLGEPVISKEHSLEKIQKESKLEIVEEINKKINEYLNLKYKSIAIIGKDMNECEEIFKMIRKFRNDVKLVQSKDSEYNAGISILPSYLAKGLEFDSVMLFNVNEINYENNSLDIKLLYVAITRAMSKLDIFYIGKQSKLLG